MTAQRLVVGLPVYNGENYLREALDSVLSQSFGDFILFVSDNASTDATPAILAEYAARDERVQVSRVPELITQIENINRVVNLAPGDWVKLMCHDDRMLPGCLAQIAAAIGQADEAGIGLIANGESHLFLNGYLTEQKVGGTPVSLSGMEAIRRWLTGNASISVPALTTATVRKTAFQEVGGIDSRYRYLGDAFCWIEVLVNWNLLSLPDSLTVNRIHGGQSQKIMTQQMISTHDLQQFLPSLLERHPEVLAPSARLRWRARMRPVSEAATKLTTEWLAGRPACIAGMVRRVPLYWMPMLLPLAVRAWFKQRDVIKRLGPHVPRSMIYP